MRPTGDYGRPRRRPKEAWAAGLLLLVAATGCQRARNCIDQIPPEHQADVLRVVLDEQYVLPGAMPRRDYHRAQQGIPPSKHSTAHLRKLRKMAVRYQVCVKDLTRGRR